VVASFVVSLTLCIIVYNWTFRRGPLMLREAISG
jgi:hypothetical protein